MTVFKFFGKHRREMDVVKKENKELRLSLGKMLAIIKNNEGMRSASYPALAATFPNAERCRVEYVVGVVGEINDQLRRM